MLLLAPCYYALGFHSKFEKLSNLFAIVKSLIKQRKNPHLPRLYNRSNLNMLYFYWYSQRHVHEIFIFITIRQKEAMLMIIIEKTSETGLYNNLDTTQQRLFNTEGRGKNPKNLMHTSSLHHRGTTGTCVFIFDFGC